MKPIDLYIKENAGRLTDLQISIELSRIMGKTMSANAVSKRRVKLGIVKQRGRPTT